MALKPISQFIICLPISWLSVKPDIKKISKVQNWPQKWSLERHFHWRFFFNVFLFLLFCLLYNSSLERFNVNSFSRFSIMLNVIIHVFDLMSSKSVNCRTLSSFAFVPFSEAVRTFSSIRSLKVAAKRNTGMDLHNSVCCPKQAELWTKNYQKNVF